MKIATITCHEVYNHGASLQEYALLQFLNEQGHQAEAINYKPYYLSNHFKLNAISNSRYDKPFIKYLYLLAKLPNRLKDLKRKRNFDLFSQNYIPSGSVRYTSNKELKKNLPYADAYICGSDQIWNSFFENGKDLAFYLNFVPKEKLKISYAASFAIDSLEESLKPFVKKNVLRLNAISVRETSGVNILEDLGIRNAVQVLDPVFLLNLDYWRNRFVHKIEADYLFVYDFDSNPVIKEIALNLKKDKGWKIFTVNKNIDYADKNFYLEGPEKYLTLMYNAKFVATNSFHSVAFSMIFKKQLAVVNRSEAINTRLRDLLNLFEIGSYLIENYRDYQQLEPIDFNSVESIKQYHIERSKKFLVKSLQI